MTPPRSARFRRLGIDVWVRRGKRQATPKEAASSSGVAAKREPDVRPRNAPKPAPTPKPAPSPQREAPRKRPAETARSEPQPTPFHIRCFHFGDAFAAIGEDAWPQRRLLLDVALALNGFRPAERQDVVFSWPQPGAPPDGSERAFRAFFGHRTRNGGFALLSGTRVPPLLGLPVPEEDRVLDAPGGDAAPRLLYVVPRVHDAEAKRALWRLIRGFGGTSE